MNGQYKLYDEEYASTSTNGWLEVVKTAPKEWSIIECHTDGSASTRTFAETKKQAVADARRVAKQYLNGSTAPYWTDRDGVIHYNEAAIV